jgi:O-methyltransferase
MFAFSCGIPAMSIIQMAWQQFGRVYGHHAHFIRAVDRLNRLPLLRDFVQQYPDVPSFPTRESMWDHLAEQHDGDIDFLEFGVHEGHSILHWARANSSPRSRFFGFDTFQGLPETWNRAYPKGHFDTAGRMPQTDDPRVTFFKGLFQETLTDFLATYVPAGRSLVVHIDCDLYTSALYCLTKLDPFMRQGTIIIFDEFGDVQHEFRAFNDYAASYRRQAKLVCAHDDFFTAAVEIR